MKPIEIPAPVQRYLDADAGGSDDQFAQAFVPDAKVRDEGKTIQGLEAIKAWKQASRKKYSYTVRPLTVSEDGDKVELTAQVSGTFPGSPVELTYRFVVRNDRIAELEIR